MSERGLVFLGFPSVRDQEYTEADNSSYAVANSLVPVGMEANYLKTDEPSEVARILTLDPLHTFWTLNQSGVGHTIDGFALINHNLTPGGQWRVLGGKGLFYTALGDWAYQTQNPNVIASQSNATGVITNVDEDISSPDGLVLAPTSQSATWNARFSFANLFDVPNLQEDFGAFVLRMEKRYYGFGAEEEFTHPKVTCELWESGVLVTSLGYRPVTRTNPGQILIFPFSFSDLTNTSGINIEVKIIVDSGDSATDGSYAVLESIKMYYEAASLGLPTLYDTGWITEADRPERVPTASSHYFPEVGWTDVVGLWVLIRSDQVDHSAPLKSSNDAIPYLAVNREPDTFIEAGVFEYGGAEFMDEVVPENTGPGSRINVTSLGDASIVGRTYGADLFRDRSLQGLTLNVNRDQLLFLQDLVWEKGNSSAFYVSFEPDIEQKYRRFTSFWATIQELGEPTSFGGYYPGGEQPYSLTISLKEKL